ncbi:MAG: BrnT family toxin [Burkholderiaceae bacterium]|nr:BrnT family toxin [Burkholderiaceae bacterium]
MSFDAVKDAANLAKHGVSLADAIAIEWDTVWARPDLRRNYGEARTVGVGYIGLRLYCVVFTDRGDERRIISLRKANAREVARYAQT